MFTRHKNETATSTSIFLKPNKHSLPHVFHLIRQILRRWKLFLIVIGIFVLFYLIIHTPKVFKLNSIEQEHYLSTVQDIKVGIQNENANLNQSNLLAKPYLVYTDNCRIKDADPFNYEVMVHFKQMTYQKCKSHSPLTQVDYDEKAQHYELKIDKKALENYSNESSLNCCYMGVERVDDDRINYTSCETLMRRAQVANQVAIIVKCSTAEKQVYINAHAMVPERPEVRQRLTQWASRDADRRVPSVLMIGIDSVSRLNLKRAMPKTAQYLYDNDWFPLEGYNKIDDNTFPNLMAVLAGYNMSTAMKKYNPYHSTDLDKCKFLWNLFQEHGYVTAYAEDNLYINTFNYMKKGFGRSPTDYYLRPYMCAAEQLRDSTDDCLGYKKESEHVYDYALEFARRYRNDSFFGFFWTNSHSHDDISQPSYMDDYLKDYLQRLVDQGTMENSIVVFLSDHGTRFGPTRTTWTGHYEERLPFLFIWLPQFVREAHPEFVEALRENRNRLTTPFDLHITLKHILAFSGRASSMDSLGGAQDCPKCQSLLEPVPLSRSCKDVEIEDHWCTCWSYDRVDRNSKTVLHITNRVVEFMNSFIANYSDLCETLSLNYVIGAYRSNINKSNSKTNEIYLIHFSTMHSPALFEATATYDNTLPAATNVRMGETVSRIDRHKERLSCVREKSYFIKTICLCKKPWER